MNKVILYTRAGCHLCEDAKGVLDAVRSERPFDLDVVDIDTDPALREAYKLEIPVVLVDGRKAFKYRVDPRELRARLDRSSP
jgi:glutaredoxin